MQIHLFSAARGSQTNGGEDLLLVAVDASRGEQSEHVHRSTSGGGLIDSAGEGWILVETAVFYCLVNA